MISCKKKPIFILSNRDVPCHSISSPRYVILFCCDNIFFINWLARPTIYIARLQQRLCCRHLRYKFAFVQIFAQHVCGLCVYNTIPVEILRKRTVVALSENLHNFMVFVMILHFQKCSITSFHTRWTDYGNTQWCSYSYLI